MTAYSVYFLNTIYMVAWPIALKIIIDKITNGAKLSDMYNWFFLLLILSIFAVVGSLVGSYLYRYFGYKDELKKRNKILSSIINSDFKAIKKYKLGEIINTYMNDGDVYGETVTIIIPQIFQQTMNFFIQLLTMFLIDWRYCLIIIPLTPINFYFMRKFAKKIYDINKKKRDFRVDLTDDLNESLNNLEFIKGNNYNDYLMNKLTDLESEYLLEKLKLDKSLISAAGVEIISTRLVELFVVVFGLILTIKGYSTVGTVVAFTGYIKQIIPQFNFFTRIKATLDKNKSSLEKMDEFNNIKIESSGKKQITEIKDINIKNLYFKYDKDYILKNINMEFKKGNMYSIVGKSGAGKSTIIKLLISLFDDCNKNIFINKEKLESFDIKSYRNNLGYISQNVNVFPGNIYENLTLGVDYEDSYIEYIIKKTHFDTVINNFENGIHTNISRDAVQLSGGQKQLLALTRVLLKNPDVIILDESTSAIDSSNEKYIKEILNSIKVDKIVICISHRLSTIINSDTIYLLNEGCLINSGNHESLLEKSKEYKYLFDEQLIK